MVEKRFPANVTLEERTFLNDKKINGELYAFFQSMSMPDENNNTVVMKKNLPTQRIICDKLGIKSPKTFRTHLNYLIESGYMIDKNDRYILPDNEDIFFMMPLDTLQFLNDTLKDQVIKIYVYLGQRFKFKSNYVFTIAELAEHIGLKLDGNQRAYKTIDNALNCLQLLGLIDYVVFYDGSRPQKRLTQFSFNIKK